VGPIRLSIIINIAASNQVNSKSFHSQAEQEKALEEVSILLKS